MFKIFVAHPVHLPPQMVPRVHHLMRQRVLHVLPVPDLVGTEEDAVVGAEAARLPVNLAVLGKAGRAPPAHDVVLVQVAVEVANLLGQEADDGEWVKSQLRLSSQRLQSLSSWTL
uniref:Uncharacterized protein n=1 Tax=Bionectria ochroleuca TaxID=29856 RepID=A0A8H7NAF4_BIOOC